MLEKDQLKKFQLDNRGLTLVELIVSLAISSLVILGAYTLVMIGTQSYQRTNTVTNVQQEVTFASNMVGEAIISGNSAASVIWKVPDGLGGLDEVLYLGYDAGATSSAEQKRVFHYDDSENKLYVYASEGDIADTSDLLVYINKSDDEKKEHLVSKYIESFDLESVCETEDVSPTITDYESMLKVTQWPVLYDPITGSKLIKVTMTVQVKDKKDTSGVIYQIRN